MIYWKIILHLLGGVTSSELSFVFTGNGAVPEVRGASVAMQGRARSYGFDAPGPLSDAARKLSAPTTALSSAATTAAAGGTRRSTHPPGPEHSSGTKNSFHV